MSINVQPTPENKALAAAVEARMAADSRIVNARAAMLRAAGTGGLVALIGVGMGAAFFGFSYVMDAKSSAVKIADALVAALERTTLKTSGEVKIAEDAKVKLDGTTVMLDPKSTVRIDSTVKLDPDATVKLDRNARINVISGGGDTPRPTNEQLRPDTISRGGAPTVTNFTVFKNVAFGQGKVVTGWNFSSSEQDTPSHQYCYYTQDVDSDRNAAVQITLANNGAMLPNLKPQRSFDVRSAAISCIWFNGGITRQSN